MRYFFATFFTSLLIAGSLHAATLSLGAPTSVTVGMPIAIDVVIDTGGVAVNSVEASIPYPSDLLTFTGYQDNAGVVPFWIKPPTAEKGTISFTGGIPGGVSQSVGATTTAKVTLVRLLFTPTHAGSAVVRIGSSTVLQNDGKGTPLSYITSGATISIKAVGAVLGQSEPTVSPDTTAPLPLTAQLIPRDRSTNTPALLIFHTADQESGISSYQVKLGWGRWHDAVSPYPVPHRFFSTRATIRAIDGAGNMQTTHIAIPGTTPWWVVAVVIAVLGAGFYRLFVVQKSI